MSPQLSKAAVGTRDLESSKAGQCEETGVSRAGDISGSFASHLRRTFNAHAR